MTDSRWTTVDSLVEAALERSADERVVFLNEACAGDAELRQEVESLLEHHRRAGDFLERPALELVKDAVRDLFLVGRQFGNLRIVSLLGTGGMGEVFRAHDTKLDRDVAIKILPPIFASDAEPRRRLEHEGRLLAALNHPHIGAIYGLEEVDGTPALILELVDGETLADLAQRPLPIDEAVRIARQIADALQAAHECAIIHRDLKPANIKVRGDGTVKVLDFGLAKTLDPPVAGQVAMSPAPSVVSIQEGMILGTTAYMAPEQVRGKPADKRADVWAFGCVLYEMLAGKRAFGGDDPAAVLASVITGEPDWAALPPDVPLPLLMLMHGCLQREPRARVADIGVASFLLDHAAELVERVADRLQTSAGAAAALTVRRRPIWRLASWMIAAGSLSALVAGVGVWVLTRAAPIAVVRLTVTTSGTTALTPSSADRDLVITPDGSRVVYRGNNQLLLRALNQLEPTVLVSGEAPHGVFSSPDGQWIGFFDGDNLLKKVPIRGGSPMKVCAAPGASRGATWSEDGTIIFATNSLWTGLHRVSAAGGEAVALTRLERGDTNQLWPEVLPGGKAVVFTISPATGTVANAQIAVLNLQTGKSKVLINGGSHAHYVPTGHLVYGAAGTLRAVAFDLRGLEVVGTPASILDGVVTTAEGAAEMAFSANGSLVYVPGGPDVGAQQTIMSVDRQGRAAPLPGLPAGSYRDIRVSPDGARLALATQADVWTYDLGRAMLSRLTTHPASETRPLWTADGQRIIFSSNRSGYPEIFWRPADGTGSDERLLARDKGLLDLRAEGWSADHRELLFAEVPPDLRCAIGQLPIERRSEVRVLLRSEFCPAFPAVSPDGRWVAYHSRESGLPEIYVEAYPELGNRLQISMSGGTRPLWSRTGRELFFSSSDGRQMFAVPVQSGSTLITGRPQFLFEFPMFEIAGGRPYDLAPDGRFFMIRRGQVEAASTTPSNMIVVLNWFEELKRLVRTN